MCVCVFACFFVGFFGGEFFVVVFKACNGFQANPEKCPGCVLRTLTRSLALQSATSLGVTSD